MREDDRQPHKKLREAFLIYTKPKALAEKTAKDFKTRSGPSRQTLGPLGVAFEGGLRPSHPFFGPPRGTACLTARPASRLESHSRLSQLKLSALYRLKGPLSDSFKVVYRPLSPSLIFFFFSRARLLRHSSSL